MADCPKCAYVGLHEKTTEEGLRVDECDECGGRWYDAGELEASAKDPAALRAAIESPLDEKAGTRPCARCLKPMVNRGLLERLLRVDFCPYCRGFWVDKPELGLIARLLR